jgi:hypothetical protein
VRRLLRRPARRPSSEGTHSPFLARPSSPHPRIRNTPPTGPVDAGLVATGSGVGLANLRQRVELVQGTLRAEPVPDGGFRVDVTLPAYVPTAASARG